jgi:hypothetical protein
MFSQATYEAIIKRCKALAEKLCNLVNAVHDKVEYALSLMPVVFQWLLDKINDLLEKISEAFNKFWEILVDYFEGMFAPITFYARAQSWYSDVQSPMVKLGSDVDSNNVLKPSQWEGEGGNSYRRSVSDQSAACNAVATMAGTVGSTLTKCAIGGLVFYGAIIVVLIKMIAGVGAGTGATATGVGAPVGLLAILASIGIGSAEIGLLITAAVGLVTAEMAAFDELNKGFAAFPLSRWPSATD